MKKWYLIKTKPRQEKIAIANLENQSYKVYCPFALINNRNQFLFPGYLFINLDNAFNFCVDVILLFGIISANLFQFSNIDGSFAQNISS